MGLGLWWMAGAGFDATAVGGREWFVQVVLPSPTRWFQGPISMMGVPAFGLGALLWFLSFKRPDPRRWLLVGSVYPEFLMAGHLLLLMVFLSVLQFEGHVFAAAAHGIQWRSIAGVRSVPNMWVAGALGLLCLGAYVLSVGPTRRTAS